MAAWCLAARLNHNADLILQTVNVQPTIPLLPGTGPVGRKVLSCLLEEFGDFRGLKLPRHSTGVVMQQYTEPGRC